MEPPIGFVLLGEAVSLLAAAKPDLADPAKAVAEACESGALIAAYRTITGVDELDRAVWRSPAWRNYFDFGTIDLVLPLLDDNGRPNRHGYTAVCTREIFVRRDSLQDLISSFDPVVPPAESFRPAPEAAMLKEIRAVYADPSSDRPNVNQLAKLVRPRLQAKGLDASDRKIRELGERDEFRPLRRAPGKTKASDRQ